jgi:hypothetical protein
MANRSGSQAGAGMTWSRLARLAGVFMKDGQGKVRHDSAGQDFALEPLPGRPSAI